MFDNLKDGLISFFKSRLFVLGVVMFIFAAILLYRVFTLQIVKGNEYQENYALKIEKEREIKSTRGNIYDRDGTLLAYNELSYTITIEDNGSYKNKTVKNESINDELYKIITILDKNGDSIVNDFSISLNNNQYEFKVEGTSLKRFLADIYGHSSVDDLNYNKKLGYNEAEATADQVMEYLMSKSVYNVPDTYDKNMAYRIVVIRFAMSQNAYQKYISTDIATSVCDETVAYISENAYNLQGVSVDEDTIRRYTNSKYFAHIIGYTGKISQEEYESLSVNSDRYSLTDVVGKAGIEQYMDDVLQGEKGKEVVYVDNVGKVVETKERTEPTAGNDVYLSIDSDLTIATYKLLEQELAGILYEKIENVTNYDRSTVKKASDLIIPIDDVYFALINNNVLDIAHFKADDASENERYVYSLFNQRQDSVISTLRNEMLYDDTTPFTELPEETKDYITYVFDELKDKNILLTDNIDKNDDVYKQWAEGTISTKSYLSYAISKEWINITAFNIDQEYSSASEIYTDLVDSVLTTIKDQKAFSKLIYDYMIHQGVISGNSLCLILFDQGVLAYDQESYQGLSDGSVSPYNFIKEVIKNIQITPAQLALDPCSASCVITDTNTGELLALVSYPGYDNNKLANTVDGAYYTALTEDLSKPLYNYATLERTAPGSTFKMVIASAALAEGFIDPYTIIEDEGEFTKITPFAKCWAYPSNHGKINVSEALRDSCNYFFYELGYTFSLMNGIYNADLGINTITRYAKMYGLGSNSGIEIIENAPKIATEYPVRAAIGQSNNAYTVTELARYITAVANSGTVYTNTLLSKVCDRDGNIIESYSPVVESKIDVLSNEQWYAIHYGMKMVTEELEAFDECPVPVAGKTGTAQTITSRPNHALFVGYAPYNDPKISVATRIGYGYTSHNAADVAEKIICYSLGLKSAEDLLSGQAAVIDTSSNNFAD